jgi:hypothetical protein
MILQFLYFFGKIKIKFMGETFQNETYTDLEQKREEFNRVKDSKLPDAVATIAEALRNDPDYFISWQANIAMSILDEFERIKEERGVQLAVEDIHGICNRGAKHFLKLLSK